MKVFVILPGGVDPSSIAFEDCEHSGLEGLVLTNIIGGFHESFQGAATSLEIYRKYAASSSPESVEMWAKASIQEVTLTLSVKPA